MLAVLDNLCLSEHVLMYFALIYTNKEDRGPTFIVFYSFYSFLSGSLLIPVFMGVMCINKNEFYNEKLPRR